METTGIYYFSGTGNCLAISKQIAKAYVQADIIAITDKLLAENKPAKYNNCIVVYPSYGYGMPSILYKFFKTVTFECDYLAAIVSYGSQQGSALLHAKNICKRKGRPIQYLNKIKCVENYIPIFGLKPDAELKTLIDGQREITDAVINDLKEKKIFNKRYAVRPFTSLVSIIFRSVTGLLSKMFKVNDSCTKCGLCRDICPASAITMEDGGKPEFIPKKCAHCQACLNWCPKHAIEFVGMRPHTRRYTHPDILMREMRKNNAGNSGGDGQADYAETVTDAEERARAAAESPVAESPL